MDTFVQLVAGTLTSTSADEPASLVRSNLIRIEKDRAVILGGLTQVGGSIRLVPGVTRPQRVPVKPQPNSDSNSVSHSAAGLISARRGGGSFEFILNPRPNAELDRDFIVIGQAGC